DRRRAGAMVPGSGPRGGGGAVARPPRPAPTVDLTVVVSGGRRSPPRCSMDRSGSSGRGGRRELPRCAPGSWDGGAVDLDRRPSSRLVRAHPGGGRAGVPGLPPAMAGVSRVRGGSSAGRDVVVGSPLVARLRRAPRPLGPGDAGRGGIRSCLDAPRAP